MAHIRIRGKPAFPGLSPIVSPNSLIRSKGGGVFEIFTRLGVPEKLRGKKGDKRDNKEKP
jgi:hypothetical protein